MKLSGQTILLCSKTSIDILIFKYALTTQALIDGDSCRAGLPQRSFSTELLSPAKRRDQGPAQQNQLIPDQH
jgi:hypothetical protein